MKSKKTINKNLVVLMIYLMCYKIRQLLNKLEK